MTILFAILTLSSTTNAARCTLAVSLHPQRDCLSTGRREVDVACRLQNALANISPWPNIPPLVWQADFHYFSDFPSSRCLQEQLRTIWLEESEFLFSVVPRLCRTSALPRGGSVVKKRETSLLIYDVVAEGEHHTPRCHRRLPSAAAINIQRKIKYSPLLCKLLCGELIQGEGSQQKRPSRESRGQIVVLAAVRESGEDG